MPTIADISKQTASTLKAEAKAVNRTATAYKGLRRTGRDARALSRDIVIASLGGGRV